MRVPSPIVAGWSMTAVSWAQKRSPTSIDDQCTPGQESGRAPDRTAASVSRTA